MKIPIHGWLGAGPGNHVLAVGLKEARSTALCHMAIKRVFVKMLGGGVAHPPPPTSYAYDTDCLAVLLVLF